MQKNILTSLNFLKSNPENASYLLANIKISTALWSSLKISVCAVSLLKNFRVLNIARKEQINIFLTKNNSFSFHYLPKNT